MKPLIRKTLVGFAFLCSAVMLNAQQDTTIINRSQEVDFFEDQQFVNAHDFVFQTFEETKYLFKIDMIPSVLRFLTHTNVSSLDSYNYSVEAAFEHKMGLSFSQNNSIEFSTGNRLGIGTGSILKLGTQTRWFFNMKRKIKEKKSANNLSGNYFGLGFSVFFEEFQNFSIKHLTPNINFKFGLQRRIFKYGFIDIQMGPEVFIDSFKAGIVGFPERKELNWTFNAQVKLGLAFGPSKSTMKESYLCNIFSCFEERKNMFKIDIYNLFTFQNVHRNGFILFGELKFAFEHKLSTSWSLNHELHIGYSAVKGYYNQGQSTSIYSFGLNLKSQLRHYFLMRKRIAAGKSANNLSGFYYGAQVRTNDLINFYNDPLDVYDKTLGLTDREQLTAGAFYGFQTTVFKRAFIDFNFGMEFYTLDFKGERKVGEFSYPSTAYPYRKNNHGFEWSPMVDLKIGIAF